MTIPSNRTSGQMAGTTSRAGSLFNRPKTIEDQVPKTRV